MWVHGNCKLLTQYLKERLKKTYPKIAMVGSHDGLCDFNNQEHLENYDPWTYIATTGD